MQVVSFRKTYRCFAKEIRDVIIWHELSQHLTMIPLQSMNFKKGFILWFSSAMFLKLNLGSFSVDHATVCASCLSATTIFKGIRTREKSQQRSRFTHAA